MGSAEFDHTTDNNYETFSPIRQRVMELLAEDRIRFGGDGGILPPPDIGEGANLDRTQSPSGEEGAEALETTEQKLGKFVVTHV